MDVDLIFGFVNGVCVVIRDFSVFCIMKGGFVLYICIIIFFSKESEKKGISKKRVS